MLRISDGRMSGTAGGTIVLHISPESADLDSVFGIVQSGDRITCDVEQRVLSLEVSEDDIQKRIEDRKQKVQSGKATGRVPWVERKGLRGYRGLYGRRVNQAHLGCDFDFLTAEGPPNGYVE
jgi:dihydroxy-acid dehydratase